MKLSRAIRAFLGLGKFRGHGGTERSGKPYDFKTDLERWHQVALEAHSRPTGRSNIYARLQWIPEAWAHKRLARWCARHKQVLEIGIGGGEHVPFERLTGSDRIYIGIDYDPTFAHLCRDQFGLPVVIGDAASLPFGNGTFDAVVAASVLEHIANLDASLREVSRILRPGGELLVIVPTNGSLAVALFKALVTYPYLRWRGIRRPALIWHFENANHFQRLSALLLRHFDVRETLTGPLPIPYWHFAPLALFRCVKRESAL